MTNTNKWTQNNIINEETGAASQVTALSLYGKELYLANDEVSDDSSEDTVLHTDRFETFSSDLAALFQMEVADKYHLHKGQCVLHVDLTDNNMTAVVSIQHYGDYHFIVKDYKIALKD